MYTFLLFAALAGIKISLVTAPLGSFVVWRRMSYFGDTLSHAALFGVALGILLQLTQPVIAVISVCVIIGLLLVILERRPQLAADSILGMLSYTSLSLGVIVVSLMPHFRGDLFGYLFGDILAVGSSDLIILSITMFTVLGLILWNWSGLLAMTLDPELAQVEGVKVERLKILFVVLLALVIGVSMKILGVLLITAMLIIPPLAARPFCKNPEQMVILAIVLSVVSVIFGLAASWAFDIPAAPSIVVMAALQFFAAQLQSTFKKEEVPSQRLSG